MPSCVEIEAKLLDAVRSGDIREVRKFLKKGADVNAKTNIGLTSLHAAATKGHTEIAALLLDRGADVNAQYKGGFALYTAAVKGHTEIAALLLNRGADVNAKTNTGETSLHVAACEGHTEMAALLRRHNGVE